MPSARAVALLFVLLALPLARAATLTTTDAGVRIEAGGLGNVTLEYPVLTAAKELAPSEKRPAGKQASLGYPGGARIEVSLEPDGTIVYRPTGLPEGTKSLRLKMMIDFAYADGGKWRVGDGALTPFPPEKPAKAHLYQGNAKDFALLHPSGTGLTFDLPDFTYQQLQDNREWNWRIFEWSAWLGCAPTTTELRVKVSEFKGQPAPALKLDAFGQETARTWPGKLASEVDLKADVARDQAYYAAMAARPWHAERDVYGGLKGSATSLGLQQTGFFHVESKGGRWWLVDPEGNAFFHAGLCGFQPSDDYTYTVGRQGLFEWLPAPNDPLYGAAWHPQPYWHDKAFSFYVANVIRKYGAPYEQEAWRERMIDRVRAAGFTSAGNFGGSGPSFARKSFPYVGGLPLSEWQLGRQIPGLRGFFDPFDPVTIAKIDELFAKALPPAAEDPLLIGYYLDNEQAAEDIAKVIPGMKADAPAKQQLVALLKAKYPSLDAFNTAWGLKAADWDAVAAMGLPVTTAAARADVAAFTARFLDTYYRVVTEAFHKYDHRHLLLGSRWQPGTAGTEQLVETAAKYVDVLSINDYTRTFNAAFLRKLHDRGGDKPWLLSEWHYASPSDSGLPGGAIDAPSQQARAEAFRTYVEQAAALGFVVGDEWFTLIDQARTGRWFQQLGGENGNTGLFSVADRPWHELFEAAAETHARIYDVALGKVAPFGGALPAPQAKAGPKTLTIPRVAQAPAIDGSGTGWPGPAQTLTDDNQVLGSERVGLKASFQLAWDDRALYLRADVADATPRCNDQPEESLWNADAVELFLGWEQLGETGPLRPSDRHVLIGAGQAGARVYAGEGVPTQAIKAVAVPGAGGQGYRVAAALPWSVLGLTPKPGQTLSFDLALDDGTARARERQLVWSGTDQDSRDRGVWGRAVLAG